MLRAAALRGERAAADAVAGHEETREKKTCEVARATPDPTHCPESSWNAGEADLVLQRLHALGVHTSQELYNLLPSHCT